MVILVRNNGHALLEKRLGECALAIKRGREMERIIAEKASPKLGKISIL